MLLVGLSLCARAQIRDTLIVQQSEVTIELDNQGFHHVYYGDEYVVDEGNHTALMLQQGKDGIS